MRIIAGKYKGRKLEAPAGYGVRPTSGRVKESMFNLLMNDIFDSVCVDLFAGTGALGLEALSRGAARCYFCDNSRESIGLIKANMGKCGAEDRSVLLACDYVRALSSLREKADIFLIDPPYRSGLHEKSLERIDSLDLLKDDGIIIAEHNIKDSVPGRVGRLVNTRDMRYGTVAVSVYRKDTKQDND